MSAEFMVFVLTPETVFVASDALQWKALLCPWSTRDCAACCADC
jgi:hypothetical protein